MKAVGARLPRYDGRGHVSGRTQFVDDVRVPNLRWLKALRAPVDSARIARLDTRRAEALPGVTVVTHRDVPRNAVGLLEALGVPADEPLLAEDEVRYRGQPIALVAAESESACLEALDLLDLELEEREPFLDVRRALDPDAPRITPAGNLAAFGPYTERRVRMGDVDAAFARADLIVEGVYRPAAIEHCPTETQVALAYVEPGGRIVVHTNTQAMYFSMGILAAHLEVPMSRLRFVGGTVGGAFGGKVDCSVEAMTAVAAIKAGRPCKWRWTREEEMLFSSTRAAWHLEIADAVSSDGWLLGRRTLTLHDAGAYLRFSPYGTTKHTFHLAGPYTIPNVAFNSYVVMTNRVPSTAMRGFGVTSASFAIETHMNRIAHELGIDPWELRMRNANRVGDISPTRVVYRDPSSIPTMLAAADAAGVELPERVRGMSAAPRSGELLPEHLVPAVEAMQGS